jgi:hypothetical protein
MSLCTKTANPVLAISVDATEDLTAHRFVGFSGEVCDFDAKALGVVDLDWLSGDKVPVTVLGVMPVEAGEAIDIGAEVSSDGNGKALTAVLGSKVNGLALEAATAAGDFIRVLLKV